MSNPCLHEEDFGSIKSTLYRMDKEIFGSCYGKKGLSNTVAELNTEVKSLKDTSEQLRIGVLGLLKFQSEYVGYEKRSIKNWKTAAVIISFLALCSGMFFGFRNTKKDSSQIEIQMRNIMDVVYEPKFRGAIDSLYNY